MGEGTGLRTARLAIEAKPAATGDRGERGISPGTRLCSLGMVSSLGEEGVTTLGGYFGGGGAPDMMGERESPLSVSSVGDPGMGAMLVRKVVVTRRCGAGRSPSPTTPRWEKLPESTLNEEDRSESMLKRDTGAIWRLCRGPSRARIIGMGIGLAS